MENPSQSDSAGNSTPLPDGPLSSAVASGEEDLLRSLLEETSHRDEVRSASGITLLQVAIRKGRTNITRILLEVGAPVEGQGDDGKTCLELAVEAGFHEITELLLESRAKIGLNIEEDRPLLLHQGIERDDLHMTEILLKWGANTDTRNQTTYTPLMVAIERKNVPIVKLLLEHGADYAAKSDSGVSAIDLASGSEELTKLLDDAQFLRGPYIEYPIEGTEEESPTPNDLPSAPTHDPDKMSACHGFKASIIDFFIGKSERRIEASASIYEVLYGEGPASIMKKVMPLSVPTKVPSFRWYHLPANNLEWVEILLERHLAESSEKPLVLSEEDKSHLEIRRLQGVHHSIETICSTAKRPGCHTKNLCQDSDQISSQFASFVPFLHFETMSGVSQMSNAIKYSLGNKSELSGSGPHTPVERQERSRRAFRGRAIPSFMMTSARVPGFQFPYSPPMDEDGQPKSLQTQLLRGYLKPDSPDRGSSLQIRRTLDQYFYTHLDTTHQRDKDQVVSRFTARQQTPKLFMVDQLWLWIINGDTVISCLPVQWDCTSSLVTPPQNLSDERMTQDTASRGSEPQEEDSTRSTGAHSRTQSEILSSLEDNSLDIYRAILEHLRVTHRAPVKSVYAMANLITKICVSIFDPHKVPRDFQFFDFFEASLGIVADRAAQQLEYFRASITQGIASSNEARQSDLVAETGVLVEVEDIRDELNILKMVLEDQQVVLKDLANCFKLVEPEQAKLSQDELLLLEQNRVLENHLYRINKMERVADRTSKMLVTLLDLKQKQASVSEAFSAREQAMISASYAQRQADQAEETAKQGRTLMLFTVVTILFLPLSFMAAFFAINIDVFPKTEAGSIELGYVLQYMLSISAGLSIPFILITFNQSRVWSILRSTRSFAANIPLTVWAIVALAAVLLIVFWTSKLSYAVKVTMTITVLVLTGLLLIWYLSRLYFTITTRNEREEPNRWNQLWGILKKNVRRRPEIPDFVHADSY